jgi:hypothetical protein
MKLYLGHYLLLSTMLLATFVWFYFGTETIDLNLSDTYFMLEKRTIILLLLSFVVFVFCLISSIFYHSRYIMLIPTMVISGLYIGYWAFIALKAYMQLK